MNQTKSHQGIAYPQTVEVPAPLEIHPSVDPELARGLIAAVEYIEDHPEEFVYAYHEFDARGRGCIICHVEKLSNWKRGEAIYSDHPLGHWCRIFFWQGASRRIEDNLWRRDTADARFRRIEHFLRTGE